MEYLEGETLRARLHREKTLSVEASLPILVQLLEGLGAAHAAGIVHRDLKPENVYLLAQRGGLRDWVKILDFGISKFSAVNEDGMTKTGQVIGTPQYMAPEQIKAPHLVDGRTDLYAVGVIFYQLLTGHIPFKAKTYAELLFKIVYEPLPHPATLVPALDTTFAGRTACEILLKAMNREPDQRHQSAGELRDALLSLAARIGTPATGEAASSTRAFLRASGNALPLPSGITDGRGLAAAMPVVGGAPSPMPGTPSAPSGNIFPWTPPPDVQRAPAPTQVLLPAPGATPHPALQPGLVSPTPHPSFGGVPVATQAPGDPTAGRKAALAIGASVLAVAIGVAGFALTRPAAAPAQGAPPLVVDQVAPSDAVPRATAAPDEPAPAPLDAPASAAPGEPPSAAALVTAAPDASATEAPDASTAATPTATAAPARPPSRPHAPRPPAPRPPTPRTTSVLGY
jgi:serine/threonine-protein kinase